MLNGRDVMSSEIFTAAAGFAADGAPWDVRRRRDPVASDR
jgi:hypothetical protein